MKLWRVDNGKPGDWMPLYVLVLAPDAETAHEMAAARFKADPEIGIGLSDEGRRLVYELNPPKLLCDDTNAPWVGDVDEL